MKRSDQLTRDNTFRPRVEVLRQDRSKAFHSDFHVAVVVTDRVDASARQTIWYVGLTSGSVEFSANSPADTAGHCRIVDGLHLTAVVFSDHDHIA